MSVPEFSRPVRIESIGELGKLVTIAANPAECAALASRFGLIAVERLEASVDCRRKGTDVTVAGTLSGTAVQACVATAVPIPARIEQAFTLTFVPALTVDGDEMELDAGDLDVVAYDGSAVDLGEAVAETFALALDPFPRSADAERVLRAADVKAEGEVEAEPGAFAGLAALKGKLGGEG